MKYLIEIDDKHKSGKNLLAFLKSISGKSSGIDFISESVVDKELSRLMKTALKSGIANKKSVLKKLGIE